MAWNYQDILTNQEERLLAERAQALAELEAGRIYEDTNLVNSASDTLLRVDRDYDQLCRLANNFVQQQQAQAPRNKFGLSDAEVEIARGIGGTRREMTDEQREQIYAQQKARLQQARRDGSYRDDQGRVFR